MKREFLSLIVAGLCLSGCASEKFEIDNPFPTRQQIEKLAAKDVSGAVVEAPEVTVVDTWALRGPLPGVIDSTAYVAKTPVEEAFYSSTAAAADTLVGSEAMHCAAREIGHFLLETEKLPYNSLERFIFARCGALAVSQSIRYQTTSNATESAGKKAAREWADELKAKSPTRDAPLEVGFWSGERDGRTAYVMTYGMQRAELEPVAMAARNGGEVELRGRVLKPGITALVGVINQGDFGYTRCEVDPRVKLPEFRVVCPVSSADDMAYFQLLSRTKTSILAETVVQQLVWPGAEPADTYRSPAARRAVARAQKSLAAQPPTPAQVIGEQQADDQQADDQQANPAQADAQPAPVEPIPVATLPAGASVEGYSGQFIALLNRVREDAQLNPVMLADRQSASIQGLTTQFFNLNFSSDEENANTLSMGILAGWDVGGPIISATFSASQVAGTHPVHMLEHMIELPMGRMTLLAPDTSEVALGTLEREEVTAAIVASYEFVPDMHPNRRVGKVIEHLNTQRKPFGSRPAKEDARLRATARGLGKALRAGEVEIIEARDKLMDAALKRFKKPIQGYAFVSHSLDDIEFPRVMLTSKNLPVSVVATPYEKPGYPWTIYVILVVYPQPPASDIAAREPAPDEGPEAVASATQQTSRFGI